MTTSKKVFSAEMITAISAVIAALIALAVGVWENVEMRRHNRLSVVPHLNFTARVSTADTTDVGEGVIWLDNEGVGPARLGEFRVLLEDEDGDVHGFDSWGEAIPFIQAGGVRVRTRAEMRPGLMLGAGRRLELIRLEAERESAERILLDLMNRLQVTVAYHSIYEEEFFATFNPAVALEGESPGGATSAGVP